MTEQYQKNEMKTKEVKLKNHLSINMQFLLPKDCISIHAHHLPNKIFSLLMKTTYLIIYL